MENSVCSSCRLPKGILKCECCFAIQCKNCIQKLKKESFSFLEVIPKELSYRKYCGSCFDEKVAPALESYREVMTRAKEVFIFSKSQGEETRLIRRTEKPIKVTNCDDRNEIIMRLAFFAAQSNFNALVDVVVTSEKKRNEGYQTTKWQGIGVPVNVDADKYNSR